MDQAIIGRPSEKRAAEINDFFRLVLENTFKENGLEDMATLLKEEMDDKRCCLQQDFLSHGNDRFFLIAEIDGKIVGTIEYGKANDLICQCTDGELAHVMEVGTVFVDPKHQGKGIGKRLSLSILEAMNQAGLEEFCFDSGYTKAQEIWAHIYGKPEYHLKDFWGDGGDHMVWHLNIQAGINCLR